MRTTLRIGAIVIYCGDFQRTYTFWREALGYVPRDPPEDGFGILRDPAARGPEITVEQRQSVRAGKRSRLHLDLYTLEQSAEVDRLLTLGATRYPWRYQPGANYVVFADSDDNLFCVIDVSNHPKH